MADRVNLDNISIVLMQPRYSENIGAAARAMRNMGIHHLVIVDPRNFDLYNALKLATHFAADIVEKSSVCEDLGDALAPFNYVVGATARLGKQRTLIQTPSNLAQKLIPISIENRIAILFGPEDKGLSNEDLRYCQALVNIPTTEFSSLNLAQAVMIVCYEIFMAAEEKPLRPLPRLANRFELEGMYNHLSDILLKIGFINPQNPEHWMLNIRRFLSRLPLGAREVRVIRGICRQINWYAEQQDKLSGN